MSIRHFLPKIDLTTRLTKLKLMIFDVDGVLTDGRLYYAANGEALKVFHALDGHGLKMLQHAGIQCAIISGRQSEIVKLRAQDLGISLVFQGIHNKLEAWQMLCKRCQVTPDECGFMGDDVIDLSVLTRVGFAASVPNAVPEVLETAHWVSENQGGQGAVREVCDLILSAKGFLSAMIDDYTEGIL